MPSPLPACLLASALLLTSLPALPAQAPQGPGLAEHLPPATVLVFRIRDVARAREWLASSPFAALAQDPEVKPVLTAMTKALRERAGAAAAAAGVDLLALAEAIRGEVLLAVTGFQLNASGPVPFTPGFLLAVDLAGGDREAWEKALTALLARLPAEAVQQRKRPFLSGTVQTLRVVKKERRWRVLRALGTLYLHWHGDTFFVTNDRAALERTLRALEGKEEKTLGQTLNWQESTGLVQGSGDVFFFANLEALSQPLEVAASADEEAGAVVAALGLEEFPAIAMAMHFLPRELRSNAVLRYTGTGRTGLGALLAFRDAPLAIPRWVPRDAVSVVVLHYDAVKAFTRLADLVGDFGEEALQRFQQFLEMFELQTGVSLDREVLPAVVGPFVIVRFRASWEDVFGALRGARRGRERGGQPQILGLGIQKRAPLEKLLAMLEDRGAEVTGRGRTLIYSFPLVFAEQETSPYLALTERYLLISFGPRSQLERALETMEKGGGFGTLPEVRRALAGLPQRAAGLTVSNYAAELEQTVNLAKVASRFLRLQDLARLELPSSKVFRKYFGYTAGVIRFRPGRGLEVSGSIRFGGP